jgi:signal transduction histidine kinase
VTWISQFARRYWFDAFVVFVAVESAIEQAARHGSADAPRTTLWFDVPAASLAVLTLLGRRRFPFGAPAAFWLAGAAISFADGRLMPYMSTVFVAGMAASFLLGNLRDPMQARVGLAIVAGSALIILYNKPDHGSGSLVFVTLLFCLCWLGGFAVRSRAEQAEAAETRAVEAEHERDAAARIAVAEERTRIARELHDVVAHAVSVMVLQTGAVRHRLPTALADDIGALRNVEATGRSALIEMRRLLGAMRTEDDGAELLPQPGLERVDALVADVAAAGLPVEVHVDGEPFELPRALDLSAYRIVQEGLTNALKHARATHADVTLRYRADEVGIEVRDDGAGSGGNGSGYGLAGIGERVKIYGGEMSAGPAAGGGFVLTARLPVRDQP